MSKPTRDQTFKDPKAAFANAKKLFDAGEISQADLARIEKKLVADDQDGDLKAWLLKTYPREGGGAERRFEPMAADNTAKEQRGTPFAPGASGNPDGRPKGSRNKATLALEALLDGQAEALTQKAIDLALAGEITALRLCLDRILPARRDRPVSFEMLPIATAEDAKAASAALLEAVAAGNLTPSEASEIGKLVDGYVKSIELTEVLARLDKLEGGKA
jgi:Family of unknown function (DUF5681)